MSIGKSADIDSIQYFWASSDIHYFFELYLIESVLVLDILYFLRVLSKSSSLKKIPTCLRIFFQQNSSFLDQCALFEEYYLFGSINCAQ